MSMYQYFNDDCTEQDFLNYLEKIDWRCGDIFENVEDKKYLENLKKKLLPEEKYQELKNQVESLGNFLTNNNLHYRNSERSFRNFKYYVLGRHENIKKEIEELEAKTKEMSGIIITKFAYTPAVKSKTTTYYNNGYDQPAKMEIYLENLLAKKPYKIELSRWSNFKLSKWKRLNKRKRGEGKKPNVSKDS